MLSWKLGLGTAGRCLLALSAALLGSLSFPASDAQAVSLSYDVVDGTAGVFGTDGGVFVVTQNLDGNLALESPGSLMAGSVLTYTEFELEGTGQLCEGCEQVAFDIVLDESVSSTLSVIDDLDNPGTLDGVGEIHTLWTITGGFGAIELAVTADTALVGDRNVIAQDYFWHTYEITSVVVLSNVPAGVDLSSLDRLKLTAVPEPGTFLLLAAGLGGLAAMGQRRTA
jgi:hypothetical protein